MRDATRWISSAAVGGLVVVCADAALQAQGISQVQPVSHIASIAPGSIHGTVQDEKGAPVAGAMVSALGATNRVVVADRTGRFDLRTLSPGPYLLRAYLTGFVASRGQVVEVRPSARVSSSIAIRHAADADTATPVLAAGVSRPAENAPADAAGAAGTTTGTDDHSELAWRLRHLRRGILKDGTALDGLLADDGPETNGFDAADKGARSPARFATSLFAGTPFSGQLNLLTTGSFDTPQQLFSSDNFSRSIAYVALGAPVGEHADWTARAALTQGDIASWFVAGEYLTRSPARHKYDIGVSYSTQRYDGGNFAALRAVTDGSRNAGAMYGFDTFAITPAITVSYGGRYARYDYLESRSLISPRVGLVVAPAEHFRVTAAASRRALAPGAEEFSPRSDGGVWLPPQRTFSALLTGQLLEAERTNHLEVGIETDLASTTTVSLRAFRQQVGDQLITLFGLDMPAARSAIGHYFLATAGDIEAVGVSAGLRTVLTNRLRGSLEYSTTRAVSNPADATPFMLLFAPSMVRSDPDRIHDLATSLETDVPETATHVVVLYRLSNGFAHTSLKSVPLRGAAPVSSADRASVDSRFDVQVRQSLPFMDFNSTKWEMLVGVRNFFHETAPDQSIYDELLVLRPPKRIVGGLTLKF